MLFPSLYQHVKISCYMVSVKAQFFCLPIGQTVSRADPQNVTFTVCFAEEATDPQ